MTVLPIARPELAGLEPIPTSTLAEAAADYHDRLVWAARIELGMLVLPLTGALVAFSMPGDLGLHVLDFFGKADVYGPVLAMPGAPATVFVLADAQDTVIARDALPRGVVLHRAPGVVPLPPTKFDHGAVRWLRAPRADRRWFPDAGAVLAALSPRWQRW